MTFARRLARPLAALALAGAAGPATWFSAGGWVLEGEPITFAQEEDGGLVLGLPAGGRITFAGGEITARSITGTWHPETEEFLAVAVGEVRFRREGETVHSYRLVLGAEEIRFSGAVDGAMGEVRMVGDALTVSADMTRFALEHGTLTGTGFTVRARSISWALDQSGMQAEGLVVLQADTTTGVSLLCLAEHLVYDPGSGTLVAWPAEISLGGGITLVAELIRLDTESGGLHAEGEFRLELPEPGDAG